MQVSEPKRIQRSRRRGDGMGEGVIYVGRHPSPGYGRWGNPFVVGQPVKGDWSFVDAGEVVRDAAHAVYLYRQMLYQHPGMLDRIRTELAGKTLACWCRVGESCHGDVLLRVARGEAP